MANGDPIEDFQSVPANNEDELVEKDMRRENLRRMQHCSGRPWQSYLAEIIDQRTFAAAKADIVEQQQNEIALP